MYTQVRRAYLWGKGGLAYNYTLLGLCHRAHELRGGLRAGPHASCAPLARSLPGADEARRLPTWYPPALADATRRAIAARRAAHGMRGGGRA